MTEPGYREASGESWLPSTSLGCAVAGAAAKARKSPAMSRFRFIVIGLRGSRQVYPEPPAKGLASWWGRRTQRGPRLPTDFFSASERRLYQIPGFAALPLFAAALPTAVVLQPVANMYSRPSTDADVVSQAIFGANVGILEQKDGWAHIRTADDYTGWTPLSALLSGKPHAVSGRVADVQSLFAHIYRESNVTTHAPLLTVPFESRLVV